MKRSRGSAYPSMVLSDAVEKLRSVSNELGKGTGSRMAVLNAMGYKGESGPSGRAIASMGYYGLLEKNPDGSYSVTKLGLQIIYPETGDNKESVKIAALKPDLYSKLYERYKGTNIPKELKNILIHMHGINTSMAQGAAKCFIETMTYGGLVTADGKLEAQQSGLSEKNSDLTSSSFSTTSSQSLNTHNEGLAPPVTLPSGVMLHFPLKLSKYVSFGQFGVVLKALDDKAEELNQLNEPTNKEEDERSP